LNWTKSVSFYLYKIYFPFKKIIFLFVNNKNLENGDDVKKYLIEQTKQSTVPNVFVNGEHVGGFDTTSKLHKEGRLSKMLEKGNLKMKPI
jgi:glutaredoxin